MKIIQPTLSIVLAALLFTSCNEEKSDNAVSSASSGASSLDSFYVSEAPGGAKQISQVFADPTPGREVVLSGEIMGRMKPFVEGRAMVVLGDPTKVTPCNRIPGDECPTPWDNCCDDPAVLKKSITTIQFLDNEGNIIKKGLKGYKGIKELSFLTVKGKIAEGSNAENLLVSAESFHITDPSPYKDAPPAADYSHHGHLDDNVREEDGVFIFEKKPKKE